VAHYHSYNKRRRENPLSLTSNEAIPQQGKGRQSHDHSQKCIDPMASPIMISRQLLLGCDLKHNLKSSKCLKFKNSKENIKILIEGFRA